jgi:hypothetical protein
MLAEVRTLAEADLTSSWDNRIITVSYGLVLCHLVVVRVSGSVCPTTEDVNVGVKDDLARSGTDIDHQSVILESKGFSGNLGGGGEQISDLERVRNLVQSTRDFLGHAEDMNWRFRVDVFEGDVMVVFKDDAAGDFSSDDFFEDGHVWILLFKRVVGPPTVQCWERTQVGTRTRSSN